MQERCKLRTPETVPLSEDGEGGSATTSASVSCDHSARYVDDETQKNSEEIEEEIESL